VLRRLLLQEKQQAAGSGAAASAGAGSGFGAMLRLRRAAGKAGTAAADASADEPAIDSHPAAAAAEPLSALLVAECADHLLYSGAGAAGAASARLPLSQLAESPHPLPAAGVYSGVLSFPGAATVSLAFAPQCDADDAGRGEVLSLFRSPEMTPDSLIGRYSGRKGSPAPSAGGVQAWPTAPLLIKDASAVYWRLTCGGLPLALPQLQSLASEAAAAASASASGAAASGRRSAPHAAREAAAALGHLSPSWGFRVVARPSAGRWSSEEAVLSPAAVSMPWACWLLDLLLNQVATVLRRGAVHNQRMYDALVGYLLQPEGVSAEVRATFTSLLSQLLIHPHMFTSAPDLSALSSLEDKVMAAVDKALGGTSSWSSASPFAFSTSSARLVTLPPQLQPLLELVIAKRAAQRAFALTAAAEKAAAAAAVSKAPARATDALSARGTVAVRLRREGPGAAGARSRNPGGRPDVIGLTISQLEEMARAAYPDGDRLGALRGSMLREVLEVWLAAHPSGWMRVREMAGDDVPFVESTYLMAQADPMAVMDRPLPEDACVDIIDIFNVAMAASLQELVASRGGDSVESEEMQDLALQCMRRFADCEWSYEPASRTYMVRSGSIAPFPRVRDVLRIRKPWEEDRAAAAPAEAAAPAAAVDGDEDAGAALRREWGSSAGWPDRLPQNTDEIIASLAATYPDLPEGVLPSREELESRMESMHMGESGWVRIADVPESSPGDRLSRSDLYGFWLGLQPRPAEYATGAVPVPADAAIDKADMALMWACAKAVSRHTRGGDDGAGLPRGFREVALLVDRRQSALSSVSLHPVSRTLEVTYQSHGPAATRGVEELVPFDPAALALPPKPWRKLPVRTLPVVAGTQLWLQVVRRLGTAVQVPATVVLPAPLEPVAAAALTSVSKLARLRKGGKGPAAAAAVSGVDVTETALQISEVPLAAAATAAPKPGSVVLLGAPTSGLDLGASSAHVRALLARPHIVLLLPLSHGTTAADLTARLRAALGEASAAPGRSSAVLAVSAEDAASLSAVIEAARVDAAAMPAPLAVAAAAEPSTPAAAAAAAAAPVAASASSRGGLGLASALMRVAGLAGRAGQARAAARRAELAAGLSERDVGTSTAAIAASFAAQPVKSCLPSADIPVALAERLLWVHELSAALHSGARPCDEILCAAWSAAVGECRHVQSNHPYRAGEVLSGEVTVDGASRLALTLHPRCATGPGVVLSLQSFTSATSTTPAASRTFSGAALMDEGGSFEAGEGGRETGSWPREPLQMPGCRLRYTLRVPAELRGEGASAWGVAFSVAPASFSRDQRLRLLSARAEEVASASRAVLSQWTPEMDSDLVELARACVGTANARPAPDGGSTSSFTIGTLPLAELQLATQAQELRFASLVDMPTPLLRLRFQLVRLFNAALRDTLPCFSLSAPQRWAVGFRLRALSHAIFSELKQAILEAALKATTGSDSGAGSIELSNFKATESEVRGTLAPDTSGCMFVQAYKQLRARSGKEMRGLRDSGQSKVMEIRFEGESGIDAGGVYREGISRIVDDLFSDRFSLLVKCANANNGVAINTNAYVPNPAHRSALALSQLEFAGRFMGLSLRTKACLPFAFPSVVWKAMVGERAAFSDLVRMDGKFAELLSDLRNCHVEGRTNAAGLLKPVARGEDDFAATYGTLTFAVVATSGEEVELVPGGRELPVTFANRTRFCDAAERFRLHEFDVQLAALRRGLANVVPISALRTFTWSECEALVCGSPYIDVALLQRNTSYEGGYNKEHPVIQSFWRVLAAFSHEDRSSYVRFVWGRSRLPAEGGLWTSRHKITRLGGGDRALPMSHTCFK
jgi:hypothetical protein